MHLNYLGKNNMNIEIWKSVPGYEDYQVSTLGKVRSMNYKKSRKIKELKPRKFTTGYLMFCLYSKGKRKDFGAHQLVAMTFLNYIPKGHSLVVDHINENPLDNRLENLRILTQTQNVKRSPNFTSYSILKKKSGLPTGVRECGKKFKSSIQINGKYKYLGLFETPEEASEVYQRVRKIAFEEYQQELKNLL